MSKRTSGGSAPAAKRTKLVSLEEFCAEHGLSKFLNAFADEGVSDTQDFLILTEDDKTLLMSELKMVINHCDVLMSLFHYICMPLVVFCYWINTDFSSEIFCFFQKIA